VGQDPVSPQFVRFTEKVASVMPWIGLSVGSGLVAVSIWGLQACRAIARAYPLPKGGPNPVVGTLSWLLFFLPIGILGAYVVVSVLRQMQRAEAKRRIQVQAQAPVVILPPPSIYDGRYQTRSGISAASQVPQQVYREPMDEATTRRLDELGDRLARIFNLGAGWFFLVSGLLGFLVMWIDSRQPASGLRLWSFQTRLLIACGFLTFIGAIMLLRASKEPDTAWLAPLQIFTRIVSVRAAAEQMKRKKEERPRLGPGSSP
jgi:hypothetical protein